MLVAASRLRVPPCSGGLKKTTAPKGGSIWLLIPLVFAGNSLLRRIMSGNQVLHDALMHSMLSSFIARRFETPGQLQRARVVHPNLPSLEGACPSNTPFPSEVLSCCRHERLDIEKGRIAQLCFEKQKTNPSSLWHLRWVMLRTWLFMNKSIDATCSRGQINSIIVVKTRLRWCYKPSHLQVFVSQTACPRRDSYVIRAELGSNANAAPNIDIIMFPCITFWDLDNVRPKKTDGIEQLCAKLKVY